MTILNLLFIVFLGILFFISYFHISNLVLDAYGRRSIKRYNFENSIRVIVFIAPAFIVLFIFILYPVFETVRLSFYDKFGREFVGLYNYKWAIGDPEFRRSILNNFVWLLVVPTLSTFFGLVIAKLADNIWWGSIAKSIIFMPMAISFVGAGVIWKFIYEYRGPGDTQIGLLNAIIVSFGYEPQAWITIPFWNNFFLMAIMIWIQTGLALVIFSAALRSIPKEMLEAARIDGAGFFKIFFRIILPISAPILVVTVIWQFTMIWNDFLFGATFTFGNEAPIQVALNNMVLTSSSVKRYNVDMAAAIIAGFPTLIVYVLAGKYFIRGLTAGSVKG